MTEVQESDPDMYLYFAYLFYRGILLFFISWKADILPTTMHILLDPFFDDYLKQLELIYFYLAPLIFIKVVMI